jgi:signal peptidase II
VRDDGVVSTDDPTPAPAAPPGRKRILLLVGVAVTVLALDLATKVAAVAQIDPLRPVVVPGGFLELRLLRNPGAAFSLATGMTWLLTLVAVVVVVVIVRMARKLRSPGWAWGLGLVLGGALGNLVDRLFRAPGPLQGHVVDFVALVHDGRSIWPVFNVADSCIITGGALLVLMAFLGREPDGTRSASRTRRTASATSDNSRTEGPGA